MDYSKFRDFAPRKVGALFLSAVFLYLAWALYFLASTTFIDFSGIRRFVLFDDAMISMRYALNLANGYGLVWNIGERVEGYTNPLWTLYMSALIALSGKYLAPLLVQITGLVLIIGAAIFANLSARELVCGSSDRKNIFGAIAAIGLLLYYPLSYWVLTGMEVSVLSFVVSVAVFFTIKLFVRPEVKYFNAILVCATIAYFTRPDGWIPLTPLVLLGLYLAVRRGFARITNPMTLAIMGGAIALVSLHLLWRLSYYGSLAPNTYTLKIHGHDLGMRLENGVSFIAPFLKSISIQLAMAFCALFFAKREHRLLFMALLAVPLISIGYQIFVGGDPWPYWRQMAPSVYLFTLVSVSALGASERFIGMVSRGKLVKIIFSLIVVYGFVVLPNENFKKEILLRNLPYQFVSNVDHAKEGMAINEIMSSSGSVMSFWAGAIPYFAAVYAIDPLGKTDPYIANLPPDRNVAWAGMNGVPGHNKYDLAYSIINKSPDYIQGWKWFGDDLSEFVQNHYVAAEYGGIKICLRRGSESVDWSKVNIIGDCVSKSASSL